MWYCNCYFNQFCHYLLLHFLDSNFVFISARIPPIIGSIPKTKNNNQNHRQRYAVATSLGKKIISYKVASGACTNKALSQAYTLPSVDNGLEILPSSLISVVPSDPAPVKDQFVRFEDMKVCALCNPHQVASYATSHNGFTIIKGNERRYFYILECFRLPRDEIIAILRN